MCLCAKDAEKFLGYEVGFFFFFFLLLERASGEREREMFFKVKFTVAGASRREEVKGDERSGFLQERKRGLF